MFYEPFEGSWNLSSEANTLFAAFENLPLQKSFLNPLRTPLCNTCEKNAVATLMDMCRQPSESARQTKT